MLEMGLTNPSGLHYKKVLATCNGFFLLIYLTMQNKYFLGSDLNWANKKKKKIHWGTMSLQELEHGGKQSASYRDYMVIHRAVHQLNEKLSSLSCN